MKHLHYSDKNQHINSVPKTSILLITQAYAFMRLRRVFTTFKMAGRRKLNITQILHSIAIISVYLFTSAVQSRELKIYGIEEAPLKVEKNGEYSGIDIDITHEVLQRLSIPHHFSLLKPGARLLRLAENGMADMILAISKKKERESYLYYPEHSYLDLSWHFFIRKEDANTLHFNTIDDLVDKKIGAVRGYAYTNEFWNSNLDLLIVPTNDQLLPLLLAKRVQAVPMNRLITRYKVRNTPIASQITYLPTPLRSAHYYNAFSKHSDYPKLTQLIKRYDETLQAMQKDGTIQAIFDQYLQ